MYGDDLAHRVSQYFNVGEYRWVRPVRDDGPGARRISGVSMSWLGTEDSPAVTDADEQHPSTAICEAHDSLNQLVVVEGLLLELRGE